MHPAHSSFSTGSKQSVEMHKVAVLILTAVVAVSGAPGPDAGVILRAIDAAVRNMADTLLSPMANYEACQNKSQSCIDCSTLQVCANLGDNSFSPIMTHACSGNTPYCYNDNCVSKVPADSPCSPIVTSPPHLRGNSFWCSQIGYFPNASSCTAYHFCDHADDWAFDYDCSHAPYTIYDQRQAMCAPVSEATCFLFDCRDKVGQYVVYPPHANVYALCTDQDTANVTRCVDENFMINQETGKCERYCKAAGRFPVPDSNDNRDYIECVSTGRGHFVGPYWRSCVGDSVFDAAQMRCVPIPPATMPPPTTPEPTTTAETTV